MIKNMTHIGYTEVSVRSTASMFEVLSTGDLDKIEQIKVPVYYDRGKCIIDEPYPTEIKPKHISEWVSFMYAIKIIPGANISLKCECGKCGNEIVSKGKIRNGFYIDGTSGTKYPVIDSTNDYLTLRILPALPHRKQQIVKYKVVDINE